MKFPSLLLGCLITLTTTAAHAQSTNRLQFPAAGFSIAPLEAKPAKTSQLVVTMSLPPTEGFAPNVNVMLQPFEGSIEDYKAATLGQFESLKLKLVQSSKLKHSAITFEYSGKMKDQDLHWYARAEKANGRVYLVTATALESQWSELAPRLKACVDSFKYDSIESVSSDR